MNKEFLVTALKSNWYLVLALIALPLVGVFMALRQGNTEDDVQAASVVQTMSEEEAAAARAARQEVPWARAARRRDNEVAEAIKDYQAQIHEDVTTEDSAGALARMANLYYSKLGDFENAALYYEILLREHPHYTGNKISFANLASCYERLKEYDLAQTVYERMRDHFGPGTKEYEYASYKLSHPRTIGVDSE